MTDLVEYCRPQVYIANEWCPEYAAPIRCKVIAHGYLEATEKLRLRPWYGLRHVGPVKEERVGR